MNILVADDDDDVRVVMQILLEQWGHQVDLAEHGQQAVDRARVKRPSVILMDLRMPGMDGFTAARILRDLPETAGVPIIAVSAYVSDKVWCDRAIAAGCVACLGKPVNYADLATLLERLEMGLPAVPDDNVTESAVGATKKGPGMPV